MENDIVPELLKKIKQDFFDNAEKSAELEKLLLLLKDGKATYQEAYQFATKIGGILSKVLQTNISSSILPDGKMHYNIAERILSEMLGENHKMVSGYSKQIQEVLNKDAGVGLKTVIAPINQNRIDGLVNRLSHESSFDDVSWILGAPVVNFSQNVVDNHIKFNADFHYKSGLKPKIIRTTNGKCCDWCDKLAGVYFYPKVDKNVFRRHDRCDCTVDYFPGDGKKQNVWSKNWSQEATNESEKRTQREKDLKDNLSIDDKNEYKRIVKTIGRKNAPISLDKFIELKYNNIEEYNHLLDKVYIQKQFKSGEWGKIINPEKQEPHNELTHTDGKSYLYSGIDAQELFNKYSGTGKLEVSLSGVRKNTEVVTLPYPIGVAVSKYGKVETRVIKIHHSKNRTHIVPKEEI